LAVNRACRQQEYVDNAVRAAVAFLDSREFVDPARFEENRGRGSANDRPPAPPPVVHPEM
jgi:hypothetical protein